MWRCSTASPRRWPSSRRSTRSFFGCATDDRDGRSIEIPSVEPTADGYVVFTTNSVQQYSDFCVLIGDPQSL